MVVMSLEGTPMKDFLATYRGENGQQYEMHLVARSLSSATLSASELIPRGSALLKVIHNPSW